MFRMAEDHVDADLSAAHGGKLADGLAQLAVEERSGERPGDLGGVRLVVVAVRIHEAVAADGGAFRVNPVAFSSAAC